MPNKKYLYQEKEDALIKRLNRIQGQIEGLKDMIKQGRYCVDILQQVSSVFEALRGFSKEISECFLKQCLKNSLISANKTKQEKVYKELLDVIYKYIK